VECGEVDEPMNLELSSPDAAVDPVSATVEKPLNMHVEVLRRDDL
jgi:hypothetical protein